MLKNLNTKQKIIGLSSSIMILFMIYGFISGKSFSLIINDSEYIENTVVPEIIHLSKFEKYILDMQLSISNAIIENNFDKIGEAKEYFNKASIEMSFIQELFKNNSNELKNIKNLELLAKNLFTEGENIANKFIVTENKNIILEQSIEAYSEHLHHFENEIEKEIQKVENNLKSNVNEIIALSKDSLFEGIVLLVIGVLIGFTVSVVIIKQISKSLDSFKLGLLGFFAYLNRESNTTELLEDSSKDEFGQMAKVVNENIIKTKAGIEEDRKLIDETIAVLGEFEQGDLCQRLNITVSNPALMQLKDVLNNMANTLELNIDNVLKILEQYSNYNYLNKISTKNLKEHLLKLSSGVNSLGDSITQMLIENKTNGLTLDKSSNILLGNVDKLNLSSNEAAASLEETAAALEEITSNIRNNTESIAQMSKLSANVTTSANQGERLANQTTTAMDEINNQVNLINDAIGVIDNIAFQTNILSLNAAVEAATAGEAGKGFAVVAAEVRNLASRSAEAAKEIKDIVELATIKANEGKQIANNMIEGYKELNGNISQTINLISDIQNASKEQLLGIEQINDAVNQLDQQTQQNAMVASQTHDIAIVTDEIAKLIVSDADAKEFANKDKVKAKDIEKKASNKVESTTSRTKVEKTISKNISKKTSDDWEEF
ncbi:chemotaxis protein [Arcobacter sp. FW59]|nr:chemotaxis protein [Arcobacter sp. FW59]